MRDLIALIPIIAFLFTSTLFVYSNFYAKYSKSENTHNKYEFIQMIRMDRSTAY